VPFFRPNKTNLFPIPRNKTVSLSYSFVSKTITRAPQSSFVLQHRPGAPQIIIGSLIYFIHVQKYFSISLRLDLNKQKGFWRLKKQGFTAGKRKIT
jgi:hypothetical protein